MNKKEQLRKKALRQQEIVNSAKTAARDLTVEEQAEFDGLQREIDTLRTEIATEEREDQAQAESQRAVTAERARVADITTLCREFDMDPAVHISDGTTVDQVRSAILEDLRKRNTPSTSSITITKDAGDKFREAASDAILMRAGVRLEKPADGSAELRRMSLRDLAVDCLIQAGQTNANRMDDDNLFRTAMGGGVTGQSAFSAILDNTVNKSMRNAYEAANTTYDLWTSKGSNPDFKPTSAYQISEAGELEQVKESGEFKHDEMSDSKVAKQLVTFGKTFSISRQALINDDIGIITKLPAAYVRAAKRGINKAVYAIIGNNPAIYDGKALFHADHGNLGATGAISVTTVGEGRALMRKQKNLRGKEYLNIPPKYLIVPAAKETDAEKFINSIADPASNNANVVNPFNRKLTVVSDAFLDDYSATAWYLAADPSDIDTIEVTYLNGQEIPVLESSMLFDQLGMKWRIYIDYGITVIDFRGLVKNAGA
jgi:hypothetical protein